MRGWKIWSLAHRTGVPLTFCFFHNFLEIQYALREIDGSAQFDLLIISLDHYASFPLWQYSPTVGRAHDDNDGG